MRPVDSLCEENAQFVGGLSALDASTGVGLDWWHPITLRGAGTMYLNTFPAGTYDTTHSGLALGTDVDVIAGTYHAEESLLPGGPVTTKTPFGPIPSGLFDIEDGPSLNAPMCLDDPGNSSAAGTAVDMAKCLNAAQQNWSVPAVGKTGPIQINGLCLDTAAGGTTGGSGVVLSTCSSTSRHPAVVAGHRPDRDQPGRDHRPGQPDVPRRPRLGHRARYHAGHRDLLGRCEPGLAAPGRSRPGRRSPGRPDLHAGNPAGHPGALPR